MAKHGGKRAETGPRAVIARANLSGAMARHFKHVARCHHCGKMVVVNSRGEAGWPDVDVFLPGGRLLLIEWKGAASGGKRRAETCLSPVQRLRVGRLRGLGFDVLVTGDHGQVNDVIQAKMAEEGGGI